MHETVEYKGRTITAETYKAGHGFRWSYQIDAGPLRESRDRPLGSEQLMLNEAIDNAKREIDNQK